MIKKIIASIIILTVSIISYARDIELANGQILKDINIYRIFNKTIYISHSDGMKKVKANDLKTVDLLMLEHRSFTDANGEKYNLASIIALDDKYVVIRNMHKGRRAEIIQIPWYLVPREIKNDLGYGTPLFNNGNREQLYNVYDNQWFIREHIDYVYPYKNNN